MRIYRALAAVALVAFLAGCEEAAREAAPPLTPPEYYPCNSVKDALTQADAIARQPELYTESEYSFWFDRKERLIKRAWECRN